MTCNYLHIWNISFAAYLQILTNFHNLSYSKSNLIKILFISCFYTIFIYYHFITLKVPNYQFLIIRIFSVGNIGFLFNFEQIFLPIESSLRTMLTYLSWYLGRVCTHLKKQVYTEFNHMCLFCLIK